MPSLNILKEHFPFLNIALYLNSIPLISELTIENAGDTDIAGVQVNINADQPCFLPFSYAIESIPAGKDVKIALEGLKINRGYLAQLSETEKAVIGIEVLQNGRAVCKDEFSVGVHPLEYFGGFETLPELIAAYVTPNHPYIYHLKRRAAELLERNGQKAAFDGYQLNSQERVLQVMAALYAAIQAEEIIYSSLPPGYEETGQRLRLLHTIKQERFANCIDLSLLFAACLEAADLNPVIVIIKGHAFVGCWLQDDKFAEIINDDKTAITKRLYKGIREMSVLETTSLCKGNNIRFADALNMGERQLAEQENFILSIDIKRARAAHIRPLPLLHDDAGVQLDEAAMQRAEGAGMDGDFSIGAIYTDELLQGKQPATKQKVWERKLLDLSLRNNLLNLRMTRNMLQLVDIDISHLEDTLSDGKSFSILPDARATVLRKYNLFLPPLHHSSPLYQTANDELKYSRLLTYYHQQDLDNILSYIHKNAKAAVEENGSSTLYLAVGLLKWYDSNSPQQPRHAPILLLPVELSRRSVNSKFTLKSREEETMVNITLLEFLRQEYELDLGGLEQLPADEKGADVAKIMGTLRRAIMQMKGWDVEEQLVLGNFSFSKLILWKDIVMHQQELLKSPMVRSLVDGKLSLTGIDETPADIDFNNVPSHTVALPIATDVSQMEAVMAAQKGQSFILHGPPGTGKSQTITNIIADALYRGKRVLFVAAKKAALDVVHKRLEQVGLAPFSLELHSNKSKKSDVLEQLAKSLEVTKLKSTIDYEQEGRRLDAAKKSISDYVNLLHQRLPAEWSLYHSITTLEEYKDKNFKSNYIPESILQQLDARRWLQWTDWLPAFQSITALVVHPGENPLTALQLTQYTPALQENIGTQTQQLLQLLPVFKQQATALAAAIHFPYSFKNRGHWEQFATLVQAVKSLPDMPLYLLEYLADKDNYAVYDEWSRHFDEYKTVQKNILSQYSSNILTADVAAMEMEWKQALQSWFLPKWLKKKKIRKQLSLYKNTPVANDEEITWLFREHRRYRQLLEILRQQRFVTVQQSLKNLFKEEQTDVSALNLQATIIQRLSAMTAPFERNALTRWAHLLQQKQLAYTDDIKTLDSNLWPSALSTLAETEKALAAYRQLTGINLPDTADWTEQTVVQLQQVQAHLPRLKDWINYVQLAAQGKEIGLQWLIEAYETRQCEVAGLTGYFHYTVHLSVTRSVITAHEPLNMFNAGLFESKIEQYKTIAAQFRHLTMQELRVKLAARLPNTTVEAMQSSEIGILQKAIRNRGRGMSIRRLFDQVPTLLPRIAPCMLMSPISVAQYFTVDANHFDLVIFDEASQLPTCEAVSALARARQAIVVGDPRQMPPTSFFSTNKTDEENMEVEDLESILDDCLSLSVPSRYLLRHYRSRHESLIAFSNSNYYENKLLSFPSADDLNRKVKYQHVPGYYDKGKTRTNRFEADAIVQYIRQHYSDANKRKLSLGVVTFSQTQQNLVEDKLQELFMADAALEQVANEAAEPLFIKNLENVQGDERDIILFSVGYAPDEEGKMSMNFGPLNRNGGWRRLNVAVTRARYEMHVFATLRADQVDLSRTAAEGVAGLKGFLQFAEKGHLALRQQDVQAALHTRHLSDAIGLRLEAKGLQLKKHIGTSGFKIDIGIIHPHKPDEYILGIVVDGHYYYHARTANDREMVMPTVLKALGWNICRVWSIDWHEHADTIINSIEERVRELLLQPAATEETPKPEPAPAPVFSPVKDDIAVATEITIISRQRPYIPHALTPVAYASSETMYDIRHRDRIKQQIQMLVDAEEPISKSWLYKKLLQAWNTSRAGARLDRHLEEIISEMPLHQTIHHQPFYWSAQSGPATLAHYRSNDTERRNIEDIAPEEIMVALLELVQHNLSIEEDELLRWLARSFSFAKVGKQIDVQLRYTIELAEKHGKVRREGGRVKLAG
ncbi:DUF3320 domain-containing protein [Foetidibacter luteolus]|uniref:DUF3320 domain-containing protein n=1 Tax=Foetidibacter luteolus TaxID=2608880 RepID=UPI00129A787E|nr:DUF3320 domain-containing protein [Foetidibacter luteolus]